MSDDTYYKGTAIWISVKHRFEPRMTEWIWAILMCLWGIGLLLAPAEAFQLPAYHVFQMLMDKNEWGSFLAVLGGLRIVGLIVNGARKRVTPWIRMISAGIGFFVWLFITISFGIATVFGPVIFVYAVFCGVEAFNIYRAAKDTGEIYAAH